VAAIVTIRVGICPSRNLEPDAAQVRVLGWHQNEVGLLHRLAHTAVDMGKLGLRRVGASLAATYFMSCQKISASPTTDTPHAAVRAQGMPAM
jgi:hypothetical protein